MLKFSVYSVGTCSADSGSSSGTATPTMEDPADCMTHEPPERTLTAYENLKQTASHPTSSCIAYMMG